ncbi:MAG: rod shape-determining protein MreC [Bacteroidota bacterium]|nr:rod shape-determining protein MreC [Bacteroidota bacterium]
MRNLLKFILRIHFFLLFVIIEVFSVSLLINKNNFHRISYLNVTSKISGDLYEHINNFKLYFSLKEENEMLVKENARLRNILQTTYRSDEMFFKSFDDTINKQKYFYSPARVVNNSVKTQHNFITINKGRENGICEEMAVVSKDGVVGIVRAVTDNFATVISLINRDLKISSKHKNSGYFGSVYWNGEKYNKAILSDIPLHAQISIGDTIVTSGYSSIFPGDIIIGYISAYSKKGGSFYEIEIDLSVDFKKLSFINVIDNSLRVEKNKLEEQTKSGNND